MVFLSRSESVQTFYRLLIYGLPLESQLSRGRGWKFIRFQTRIWISIVIFCGLFYVQFCEVRGDCLLILVALSLLNNYLNYTEVILSQYFKVLIVKTICLYHVHMVHFVIDGVVKPVFICEITTHYRQSTYFSL